jgi:hypothetical protein
MHEAATKPSVRAGIEAHLVGDHLESGFFRILTNPIGWSDVPLSEQLDFIGE